MYHVLQTVNNFSVVIGNISNMTNGSSSILEQRCRTSWPLWTCIAANVCGLISTGIWFIVLFPQIWKNFRRRSVSGLSVYWATANFTASLVNLMFVFNIFQLPLYVQVSAVYMPILELFVLIQFWLFDHEHNKLQKGVFTGICVVIWATVISIDLTLHIYDQMQWVAITLWCIEMFPQILLNMKLQSTTGQSTLSVGITLIGKTTDFLSNYGLSIPLQYVIMAYFSSSLAYMDAGQVTWYWIRRTRHPIISPQTDTETLTPSGVQDDAKNGDVSQCRTKWHCSKRVSICLGFGIIGYIICALWLFIAGLVWATGTTLSLIAPGATALMLFIMYQLARYFPDAIPNL